MAREHILDLTDCTEIRQTLLARPPRVVHGAVMLIVGLLVGALVWALATEADLVVRAPGRVRPQTNPNKPIRGVEEESRVCAVGGGRVVETHVQEGKEVAAGDVLLRFDTEMLDNEIAKVQQSIETERAELVQLQQLQRLGRGEFEATQAKARAELAQVLEQINQDKRRRGSDIQLAQIAMQKAQDSCGWLERLVDGRAATDRELLEARRQVDEAVIHLEVAKQPVDQSQLEVLRQALVLNERRHGLECVELQMKIQSKEGAIGAASFELANLRVRLKHAVLRSPTDGVVTVVEAQVGDVVESGAPVVAITEQRGFRIDLGVSSDHVGHIRVGMPARIRLDAYDYQVYGTLDGTVTYIAPDTVVTPLPDGGTVASYIVRVALAKDHLENGEHQGQVKLGMTGQAEIITDKESIFSLLVRGIRRAISLG